MTMAEFNGPWLEALRSPRDPERLKHARSTVHALLHRHRAWREPFEPVPLLIDAASMDEMRRAATLILDAQSAILRHLVDTETLASLATRFDVSPEVARLVDTTNLVLGRSAVARFDVVPTEQGLKFCEINWDTTVAGLEGYDCAAAFAGAAAWPMMADAASPCADVAAMLSRLASERGLTRIAICDWSTYYDGGLLDFEILSEHVASHAPGCDVRLVNEKTYPSAWLEPGAGGATLVYRGFMCSDMDDAGAFFGQLAGSGATIVNAFETEFRSCKRWFAMFWDETLRALLTREQRDAIDRYIPQTVELSADNLADLLLHKDALVFKRDQSSGGHGVLMGDACSVGEIEGRLNADRIVGWTAQRRVHSLRMCVPGEEGEHQIVLGLYLIDGKASGVSVRASATSSVVNVSQGHARCLWAVPVSSRTRDRLVADIGS